MLGASPILGPGQGLSCHVARREEWRGPQEWGTLNIIKIFLYLYTKISERRKEVPIEFFTLLSTPNQRSRGKCFFFPVINQAIQASSNNSHPLQTICCVSYQCVSHVLTHLITAWGGSVYPFNKRQQWETEKFSNLPKITGRRTVCVLTHDRHCFSKDAELWGSGKARRQNHFGSIPHFAPH